MTEQFTAEFIKKAKKLARKAVPRIKPIIIKGKKYYVVRTPCRYTKEGLPDKRCKPVREIWIAYKRLKNKKEK